MRSDLKETLIALLILAAVPLTIVVLLLILALSGGCGTYNAYLDETYGEVTFETQYGFGVAANDFPVDPVELESVVSQTLLGWQAALDKEGINCNVQTVVRDFVLRMSFQEYPFYSEAWGDTPLYGLTHYNPVGMICEVGFREPLNASALGHELGHVINAICRNDYTEDGLLGFTTKYMLPY